MDIDGNPFTEPTNMDVLKKYHIWCGCKLFLDFLKKKKTLAY